MTERTKELLLRLRTDRTLSECSYLELIRAYSEESARFAAGLALSEKERIYGKDIYIRGLIEITNICKNDCRYCGIRKSNKACRRYRLTEEEILSCCEKGFELGFRTFVLQGGEDGYFTDSVLVPLIKEIKDRYPQCAVTLSLGERSRESYEALYNAGADRYLLRHETADSCHYSLLHPENLTLENRIRCLRDLKDIGFQVGCGFMVGSPFQKDEYIAKDLKFIEEFSPDMCGIGPFIPHRDTEYRDCSAGSVDLTCYLLSIIRLIKPTILLPATTALATLCEKGREKAILSGANVIMPNLSTDEAKENYTLYNNKLTTGAEDAAALNILKTQIAAVGASIVYLRGDPRKD